MAGKVPAAGPTRPVAAVAPCTRPGRGSRVGGEDLLGEQAAGLAGRVPGEQRPDDPPAQLDYDDADGGFALGLKIVLDGIEAQLADAPATRTPG
jgi:hypothetical protein